MSFNINISGHIHGEIEAAKAFEEKIVTDLRAWITEVESYGHSISGSFTGQHTGQVALQTPPVDAAPGADSPAPTGEGDAPATEAPAP